MALPSLNLALTGFTFTFTMAALWNRDAWKTLQKSSVILHLLLRCYRHRLLSSSVHCRILIVRHSRQVTCPEIQTICHRFAIHAPFAIGGDLPTCYSGWELVINGREAKPIAYFWRLWEAFSVYAFSNLLSSGSRSELKTNYSIQRISSDLPPDRQSIHVQRFSASPVTFCGAVILNFVATSCHFHHWFMNTVGPMLQIRWTAQMFILFLL